MSFHIIIPVRMESTRLPGKPLLDIAGKPMVQHVYERASASGAASVTIATDSDEVAAIVRDFGAVVCMTACEHPSGTDRLAEAVEKLQLSDDAVIVNVQGDEPLVSADTLHALADDLIAHPDAPMATVCQPLTHSDDLFNPNVVKVALDRNGYALYFSRAPMPWQLDQFAHELKQDVVLQGAHYRHCGLYAYHAGFLKDYLSWANGPLEQAECLEQLRVLWHGERIHVLVVDGELPLDVNTPEDLERVRTHFAS